MWKVVIACFFLATFVKGEWLTTESFVRAAAENGMDRKGSLRMAIYLGNTFAQESLSQSMLDAAITMTQNGNTIHVLLSEELLAESMFAQRYQDNPEIKFVVVKNLGGIQNDFTPEIMWDSYRLYENLKRESYDIVIMPCESGVGYYSVLAKSQGLAFENTLFIAFLQEPQSMDNFKAFKSGTTTLEIDFMQGETLKLADFVISHSQELLDRFSPSRAFIQPYFVSPALINLNSALKLDFSCSDEKSFIILGEEFVPNQDYDLILKALPEHNLKITVLGTVPENIRDVLKSASLRKNFEVTWEASQLMSLPNNTIPEKIFSVAKFATKNPGIFLIPFDTFDPSAAYIISQLRALNVDFLTNTKTGQKSTISFDNTICHHRTPSNDLVDFNAKLAKVWDQFLHLISAQKSDQPAQPLEKNPLVSVCIIHHDRQDYLRQALASLEMQEYSNFEVILVDDSSETKEATDFIASLRSMFEIRGWKIVVMPENSYLGKARNAAVQHATGKYVLFLDDDNIAKPQEIATFVSVAERTHADIYTSAQDNFFDGEMPTLDRADGSPVKRRVPLGAAADVGFVWNCYGDANSFVKRSAFNALGGFTEDYKVGYEDYEFFAKAVLKGYKLEVIPEALFWYRRHVDSMSLTTSRFKNTQRYLRAYTDHVGKQSPGLSNLFLHLNARNTGPIEGVTDPMCNSISNCSWCQIPGCYWCLSTQTCKNGSADNLPTCDVLALNGCPSCNDNAPSPCEQCGFGNGCVYCERDDKCNAGNATAGSFYVNSPCFKRPTYTVTNADQCPGSSSATDPSGSNSAFHESSSMFSGSSSGHDGGDSKTDLIVGLTVSLAFVLFLAVTTVALFLVYRYRKRLQRPYTRIPAGL
eukprot:TRINITY_DN17936_c0_g1_i1.p1 TRINITY_DN17936_c0_g1~~TRINITY_DN17936_c0_g1_i1.p1  ORF type:complete len:870 (-),score=144.69 TRINITY_DN17936_c0_g1_i1:85-2694(-)